MTADECAVVELRQYTTQPGKRDTLIRIFESNFIEPQEAVGAYILGYFRDRGSPNRFVWLRGFRDMPTRKLALETFYSSDVWKRHRAAVNDTIVDSDDVLLLQPAAGSMLGNGDGAERGERRQDIVTATIWPLAKPISIDAISSFDAAAAPVLKESGATTAALLITEPSENNFPRLPIREGVRVAVLITRFPDESTLARHRDLLDGSPRWRGWVSAIEAHLEGEPQHLHLTPAAYSPLA